MVHSPSLVSRQGCSRDAPLLIVGRVSGGRAKRLLPRRSKGGRGDAVAFASASQRPPPTPEPHGNGYRSKTAARRTPPAQGVIIAAETAAPRGCWPRDPRSGVVDKLR